MPGRKDNPISRLPDHAVLLRSGRALAADGRVDAVERPAGSFSVCLLAGPRGDEETAVFRVRGEVDLVSAPVLAEVLRPVIHEGSGPVVLDLSEVSFMDSSGVHVLVAAHRQLTPQGRRVEIACRAKGQVHMLLDLTGLLGLLPVRPLPAERCAGGRERLDRDSSLTGRRPRRQRCAE